MNLIHTVTLEYPRSLWQLRQDYPNVSFPPTPTDADLAPFDHANVQPTPQPTEYDQRLERVEEGDPEAITIEVPVEQSEDEELAPPEPVTITTWRQTWTIRAATEAEISAYDAAHAPAPQWSAFAVSAIFDQDIQNWMNTLPQSVASGISIGLNETSKQNHELFLKLWAQLAPSIPADLVSSMAVLAAQHYLPSHFIDALSATPSPVPY